MALTTTVGTPSTANTANAIVLRNGTGGFSAGAIGGTNLTASGTLGVTGVSTLGILSASGAATITGGVITNSISTASGSLVLTETGSTFGACALTLQNIVGCAGALLSTSTGSVDICDLQRVSGTGATMLERFENRSSSWQDSNNSTGEIQYQFNTSGLTRFWIGDKTTGCASQNFTSCNGSKIDTGVSVALTTSNTASSLNTVPLVTINTGDGTSLIRMTGVIIGAGLTDTYSFIIPITYGVTGGVWQTLIPDKRVETSGQTFRFDLD